MVRNILGASALTLLASCTTAEKFYQPMTQAPEQPWQGSSRKWGGYSEQKLAAGHYRISYTGFNKPERDTCSYFALVRAAEVAMLDGQESFRVSHQSATTEIEESNFPAREIPGYWDDVPVVDYITGPEGQTVPITTYRSVFVPPQRFPAYTKVNKVHHASLIMRYAGSGTPQDTREVLTKAQSFQSEIGAVHLDKKVIKMLGGR